MTPRQQRRFRKQFAHQVEQERNGAPVAGEVAARMTKAKPADILWQVNVTKPGGGDIIPLGPRFAAKDAAGMLCEAINMQILLGRERSFTKAEVVPLTLISSQGAH